MGMNLDSTPKVWSIKEKLISMDFIKIKNFFSVKDNVKKRRRQVTDWEKIFATDTSDKVLLCKIYKELLKLNNKKTDDPTKKKWTKNLNEHSTK